MKTFLFIIFCLAIVAVCFAGQQYRVTEMKQTGQLPSGAKIERKLPKGVYWLLQPDQHVFAGPQLSADTLELFVSKYPIETVIRLNLEKKSLAILDTATERRLLARHGIDLYCFNIEGRAGGLNEVALRQIDELLLKGNAYVHCLHGVHRAKAVAGRYYARRGYKKHTIFDLLDWWPVVRDHRYDRYTGHVSNQSQPKQ